MQRQSWSTKGRKWSDIVTDELEMCNILNSYISSIYICEESTNELPEVKLRYLGSVDGMVNDITIDREKV